MRQHGRAGKVCEKNRDGWPYLGNFFTCRSRLWYQEAEDYHCGRRCQGQH